MKDKKEKKEIVWYQEYGVRGFSVVYKHIDGYFISEAYDKIHQDPVRSNMTTNLKNAIKAAREAGNIAFGD